MKRSIIVLILLFGISFYFSYSQGNQPQIPKQQEKKIKPTFVVEDVVFVFQTLNTIEIKGSEVDAFLEVKNLLQTTIQKIQSSSKNAEDKIEVEMPIPLAQDMISLLQRAKFTGVNAEKFKRFTDAIIASAKSLSPTQE